MKKHPMSRLVSLLPTGSCFNDSHQRKRLGFSRKDPHEENFYGCGQPMSSGFTLSPQALLPACPAVRSLDKLNLKYPNFFKKGYFSPLIPHLKKRGFSRRISITSTIEDRRGAISGSCSVFKKDSSSIGWSFIRMSFRK